MTKAGAWLGAIGAVRPLPLSTSGSSSARREGPAAPAMAPLTSAWGTSASRGPGGWVRPRPAT